VKIPTLDVPAAVPTGGAPTLHSQSEGGFDAVSRGLAEVGHAADQAGAAIGHDMEVSRQKAIAAEVTEGETELTHYGTEEFHGRTGSGNERRDTIEAAFTGEPAETPGYMSLKGDDAFKESANVFGRLKKKREEISRNMTTDEARQLFDQRTSSQMEGYFAQIESYAAHQREVANLATLQARKDAAIEAIRSNPNNLTEVEQQSGALLGPIRALGLSDEDKAADVRKWQGEVAANQISAQLDRGDWQSAETTLKNKGEHLPRAIATQLSTHVARVKNEAVAEGTAARIAHDATDPLTGRIDDGKAYGLLDSADLPDELAAKARERLDKRILDNGRQWTQTVAKNYGGAFSTYLRTKDLSSVDNTTKNWLIDNAPEKWDELEQKQARDRDRLRRVRAEHETAGERQALVQLRSDVVRNPEKYADMTPEEFDSEWGARLSPSGYKTGGELYAGAAKGDRVGDGEFSSYVNDLVRTTPHFFVSNPNDKGEKAQKRELSDGFRADFGEARRTFRDQHKRNPTMTEVQSPEFQKSVWLNMYRRLGTIKVDSPSGGGEIVLPEMDFSGDQPAGPKGTGVIKKDKTGIRWELMSDGSARQVP
jgi:hypothetical protein